MKYSYAIYIIIPVLLTGLLLVTTTKFVYAQSWGSSIAVSDPIESQYFLNPYLANPSMAGLDSVLHLNAAFRKQFTGMPGSPVTQSFTADFNPGKRVGLGLNAYNDLAGLINRTRFALTYAYHLPLGRFGDQLHFGISAAFAHSHLKVKDLVGEEADPAVSDFNMHGNAFEIDYGMGYTNKHITLQAALNNLTSFFKNTGNTVADASAFYTAAAYKFIFDGTVNSVEPQVSLRGVRQYRNIVDIGANLLMFHRLFNLYGMYHTSRSFCVGAGINYKNFILIQGDYLTKTSGLKEYSGGGFEINLRITPYHWDK